jgi:two-component system, OmpR family, KDP operon response regulator KdpE
MKTVFIGANAKIAELATLGIGLRWPDVTVLRAATATEGLGLIARESPNLVIAHSIPPDIVLPQIIPELRAFSNVPLLALGQRLMEPELVTCLELGVDDYVQLPCSPPVLMIRIYALLRLNGMSSPPAEIEAPLLSGELFISPPASQVFLNNQPIALTPAEFRMLHFLIKNRGSVVDSRTLELAIGLGQSEVESPAPVKNTSPPCKRS